MGLRRFVDALRGPLVAAARASQTTGDGLVAIENAAGKSNREIALARTNAGLLYK